MEIELSCPDCGIRSLVQLDPTCEEILAVRAKISELLTKSYGTPPQIANKMADDMVKLFLAE